MLTTKVERVTLYTTPEELREMANKMEKMFPKLKLGDSCIIYTHYDSNIEFSFAINQEAYKK